MIILVGVAKNMSVDKYLQEQVSVRAREGGNAVEELYTRDQPLYTWCV